MRPCHRQHPAPVKNVFGQPLRTGYIRQALIENGLKQGVAARDRVADDEAIRRECRLIGIVTFDQRDPGCFELCAHGRINTGIAAGDTVPRGPGQLCNTAHEGAANA